MPRPWALFTTLCLALTVACGDDGDGGGGSSTGSSTTTTGADGSSSSQGASMSSTTTGNPECDAPTDCATCWQCARFGECKPAYDQCAANPDCAGSIACIDYMCPADGLQQDCFDHCCLNCAEHMVCGDVNSAAACIQAACSELCMTDAACAV
ncbi:MAG: hypothetical protein K1X88_10395 [Nannocystaceae bacterium]|nr:hypothetical protein [Nannocystaceae bacterium]